MPTDAQVDKEEDSEVSTQMQDFGRVGSVERTDSRSSQPSFARTGSFGRVGSIERSDSAQSQGVSRTGSIERTGSESNLLRARARPGGFARTGSFGRTASAGSGAAPVRAHAVHTAAQSPSVEITGNIERTGSTGSGGSPSLRRTASFGRTGSLVCCYSLASRSMFCNMYGCAGTVK